MNIRAVGGYTAAALSGLIALATFFGMNAFAHSLIRHTGLTVSPWYSGGEVVRTLAHDRYTTIQHRAVFDGLIGQRSEGFVQLDFAPPAALPDKISEEIDFDLDGRVDFRLEYDVKTNQAVLYPYNNRVLSIEGCYLLKERRAVRIRLRNEPAP